MRVASLVLLIGVAGCGSTPRAEPARPPSTSSLDARGEVCSGWSRYEAAGHTLFAMPSAPAREGRGTAVAWVNGEGEVYLELVEDVVGDLAGGGSDRAVIDGVLAGLGDPAAAELPEGWTVVSQGPITFEGRAAAERVIDVRGQVVRRERIVRAGTTIVMLVTMSRRDRAADATLRCFERSIVFAAPPA